MYKEDPFQEKIKFIVDKASREFKSQPNRPFDPEEKAIIFFAIATMVSLSGAEGTNIDPESPETIELARRLLLECKIPDPLIPPQITNLTMYIKTTLLQIPPGDLDALQRYKGIIDEGRELWDRTSREMNQPQASRSSIRQPRARSTAKVITTNPDTLGKIGGTNPITWEGNLS